MEIEAGVNEQIKTLLRDGQTEVAVRLLVANSDLNSEAASAHIAEIAKNVRTEPVIPTASVDFLHAKQEEKQAADYRKPVKNPGRFLWPFRFALRHLLCLTQLAVMFVAGGILGAVCGAIGYFLNLRVFRAGYRWFTAFFAYLLAIVASLALYLFGAVAMEIFLPAEEVEKYRNFDVTPYLPMDEIREAIPSEVELPGQEGSDREGGT